MATGPGTNQGKTTFVEQFLTSNLDADLDAVNEAWKSAGNDGTVSESLVSKTRSRLRREGKGAADAGPATRGKAKSSSKAKAKAKGPAAEEPAPSRSEDREAGEGPSKSNFVQETLGRDPNANVREVNRLWAEAGYEGKISDSIFYKAKRELGESGEGSAEEAAPSGEPEAGPAAGGGEAEPQISEGEAVIVVAVGGEPAAPGSLGRVVDEVEAGIDDLMFTLKASGGMPEVEAALRAARRLLVRGQEE